MNLMVIEKLRPLFVQAGLTKAVLKDLKETVEDCELGHDTNKLVGQLT